MEYAVGDDREKAYCNTRYDTKPKYKCTSSDKPTYWAGKCCIGVKRKYPKEGQEVVDDGDRAYCESRYGQKEGTTCSSDKRFTYFAGKCCVGKGNLYTKTVEESVLLLFGGSSQANQKDVHGMEYAVGDDREKAYCNTRYDTKPKYKCTSSDKPTYWAGKCCIGVKRKYPKEGQEVVDDGDRAYCESRYGQKEGTTCSSDKRFTYFAGKCCVGKENKYTAESHVSDLRKINKALLSALEAMMA